MSDDGAKGNGEDARRPRRPETAAGRRARRRAASDAVKQPAAVGAGKAGRGSSASAPAKRKGSPAPATKREDDGEKQSIFRRISRFLREVVAELRKVIWPTRKQMVTYTAVVLAFVAFMVALVWALDWVFAKAVFALFG